MTGGTWDKAAIAGKVAEWLLTPAADIRAFARADADLQKALIASQIANLRVSFCVSRKHLRLKKPCYIQSKKIIMDKIVIVLFMEALDIIT
jgi:hypothetical protein